MSVTTSTEAAQATDEQVDYTVEPHDNFHGESYVGICKHCRHSTKRKGSHRKAEAAIKDHCQAAHG